MQVVYARQPMPASFSRTVFLAGPTPREPSVASWRPAAIECLARAGYDGVVFVPEPEDGRWPGEYDGQVEWETEALGMSDAICCWVPRDLATMPGFTTNVEFGLWAHSGKLVLGAPPTAAKLAYLLATAERLHVGSFSTLADTVAASVELAGPAAERHGGERCVPAAVWATESFRSWYDAQRGAGNRLEAARLEWSYRVGPGRRRVFLWALHATMAVAAEHRTKREVVLGRPDLAVVAALGRAATLGRTKVVLVRECRLPAASADGYIRELPGGSSTVALAPVEVAASELGEETGLVVDSARLRPVATRQLVGPLSTHRAHLFALELTGPELDALAADSGPHGVASESERTWVEVHSIDELLGGALVDWSMLGMILEAAGGLYRTEPEPEPEPVAAPGTTATPDPESPDAADVAQAYLATLEVLPVPAAARLTGPAHPGGTAEVEPTPD